MQAVSRVTGVRALGVGGVLALVSSAGSLFPLCLGDWPQVGGGCAGCSPERRGQDVVDGELEVLLVLLVQVVQSGDVFSLTAG